MSDRKVSKWLHAIGAIVFALGFAGTAPAAAPPARTVAPEAEMCKGCHAVYVETYAATKHGQQGNVKGPDCQTCHANAAQHVQAGGGKGAGGIFSFNDKKVLAEKKSAVCLNCHEGNRHLAFWDAGTGRDPRRHRISAGHPTRSQSAAALTLKA